MRLTAFSDCTIRMLIYPAVRSGLWRTIDEIVDSHGIAANRPARVLHRAAQAREVRTVPSQAGGMHWPAGRRRSTIGTGLRRTGPDWHIAPCFGAGDACPGQPARVPRGVLGNALVAFLPVLDRVTPADLIRPRHHLSDPLRIEQAT